MSICESRAFGETHGHQRIQVLVSLCFDMTLLGYRYDSSFWVHRIDFLKLKNLQLGYAFPEWITSKLKMQRLYVYANAQNLFTIMWKKGYEGYDPERNTFDSGTNYYPTPRIFTFGINLNF